MFRELGTAVARVLTNASSKIRCFKLQRFSYYAITQTKGIRLDRKKTSDKST